jgi:hypothetical protein
MSMTKEQGAIAVYNFLKTPWGASAATTTAGAVVAFAPVVAIAAAPVLGVIAIGWCVKKLCEDKTD